MIRPTPWWNRHCQRAWQRKMFHWNNCYFTSFHHATFIATCTYARAFKDYKFCLINMLRRSPIDRSWWALTKSLSGITSKEQFSVPSPQDLAAHFTDKLSTRASDTTSKPHLEYPSYAVMLHQFRV